MKSFQITVWGVILLFAFVMGCVAFESFKRKSNACKIDPAEIVHIRRTHTPAG